MNVIAINNFSRKNHFLTNTEATGISRLKEIEIINQSKKDIKNFRPIYEAYFHTILNYIYQKVLDKDLAADITSQVFLKAMTNLKKYKIHTVPFSAWLYKIAYNETMQFFRKSKTEKAVLLDEGLIHGIHDEIQDFSKENIFHAIENILKYLNTADFDLIELRYYKNKSYKEIGYILGCSENTAKVRSHRLIKKIRRELFKNNQYEAY